MSVSADLPVTVEKSLMRRGRSWQSPEHDTCSPVPLAQVLLLTEALHARAQMAGKD